MGKIENPLRSSAVALTFDPDGPLRPLRRRRGSTAGMIKLENVSKVFKGDVVALREANADIAKGEFVFLVGPSGSGKSTMIRLLNKQEDPSSGRIFVAGKDIGELNAWKIPYLRRNIGCVFQDYKLLTNKTFY